MTQSLSQLKLSSNWFGTLDKLSYFHQAFTPNQILFVHSSLKFIPNQFKGSPIAVRG